MEDFLMGDELSDVTDILATSHHINYVCFIYIKSAKRFTRSLKHY
jgi:hypothetical protein